MKKCSICYEQFRYLVINPCGHGACKICIRKYIESVQYDPSKHPIICWMWRCNEKLDIYKVIHKALNKKQFEQFKHLSKKSALVGHTNSFVDHVPTKEEIQNEKLLIKLAKEQGWKRCPGCGIFVEKIGTACCNSIHHNQCYHFVKYRKIRYPLYAHDGMQFCYGCGKPQKQCECVCVICWQIALMFAVILGFFIVTIIIIYLEIKYLKKM